MDDKRTTIWRSAGGEPMQIAQYPGLPDPIPKVAFRVHLPEYGDGVCIGYEYGGSGEREEIVEVKLLVRAAFPDASRDPSRAGR